MENKHYIRLENTNITKGFSDAFETPLETDICVNEEGGRHFELFGVINPSLVNYKGIYLYKYNEDVIKKTDEEIQIEVDALPIKPTVIPLEDRVTNAEVDIVTLEETIDVIFGGV